jgi:hypothetical protein
MKRARLKMYTSSRQCSTAILFGLKTDLNLSEDQKQKLHGFLSEAYDKLQEYKQQNTGVT